MKKFAIIIISIIVLLSVGYFVVIPKMEEGYQEWADCTRVNDTYYIAGLIEEFKTKKGYFPLGASYLEPEEEGWVSVPVMVNITHRELPEKYQRLPENMSGRLAPTSELIQELSEGLGRDIKIPSDPQNVPVFAPNFYQYILFPKGNYILSSFLYNETESTVRLGKHYNKFSVGSVESTSAREKVANFIKLGVKPQRCKK